MSNIADSSKVLKGIKMLQKQALAPKKGNRSVKKITTDTINIITKEESKKVAEQPEGS